MSLRHTVPMSPWTWIRPHDPSVLEGRPLLDLGTGDAQTLRALIEPDGLVVGLDRSWTALRAARGTGPLVCGQAVALPFADDALEVIVAGDLFHHLDDGDLETALREIARVGRLLVAWWYELPGRPGPDAPGFPRTYASVAAAAERAGLDPRTLELDATVEPAPATVGLRAQR